MSGAEKENAPSREAGGAQEHSHKNIIDGDSLTPDATPGDQKGLLPDPDAAVAFLEAWRPGGPWVLTAIELDKKDAPTPTATLTGPEEVRHWIHDHSGGRWNLYFSGPDDLK